MTPGLPAHQVDRLSEWYWPCWMGMHWGFRKHAAVLWCCTGEVSPAKAADVLGLSLNESFTAVIFYRELLPNPATAESELVRMIAEAMPEAEQKHISRFYAGKQVFEHADEVQRTISTLINEAAELHGIVPLSMSDDSPEGTLHGSRMLFAAMDRTAEVYAGVSRKAAGPAVFISSECPQLIEALPSLQEDPKDPEMIASTGTEHDAMFRACLNAFSNYPTVHAETPIEVLRSEYVMRASTPTGRHMNHLRFNEQYGGMMKRARKR